MRISTKIIQNNFSISKYCPNIIKKYSNKTRKLPAVAVPILLYSKGARNVNSNNN